MPQIAPFRPRQVLKFSPASADTCLRTFCLAGQLVHGGKEGAGARAGAGAEAEAGAGAEARAKGFTEF